ncbi:MAG: hypothetical protein GXY88_01580 [Tissierellia bacterium]|nr:hypothetical protein [Tissierellia bacterium]
MAFVVADALKLECLREAQVVAGHEGLNNEIRFVNVMEVPDISDWITGYELLLTTGYPYRDLKGAWKELITALEEGKLSAFAIKPDRFIKRIPKEILEAGNRLSIPIIELPPRARFDVIIRDIMREIINRDYKTIKKSFEIHRQFTDLILSGGGVEDIANILARLTSSHVVITDDNNRKEANGKLAFHPINKN